MNYYEAVKFINDWGKKPEEYFVAAVDQDTRTYQLSKYPAGARAFSASGTSLRDSNGEIKQQFYPGDLVRVETNESKE